MNKKQMTKKDMISNILAMEEEAYVYYQTCMSLPGIDRATLLKAHTKWSTLYELRSRLGFTRD